MSKILAIDSSTEACSVALLLDGKVFKRFQLAPRKHAELLLPMVDDILKQADVSLVELDAIACCVGPGAFTGLRIAVSVAQGLAFASNLPCIAVSSLEMLAIGAFEKTKANICLSAIDARMKEIYFAIFKRQDDGNAKLLGSECVIDPLEIEFGKWDINTQAVKTGNGWSEYEFNHSIKQLNTIELLDQFPHAVDMLDIAESALNANKLLKPELLQPIYIRNNVAKKKLIKK